MNNPTEQSGSDGPDREPSREGSMQETVVQDHSRLEWTMVGVALTSVLSVLAIVISVVALSSGTPATATAAQAAPATTTPPVATHTKTLKIQVKTDVEHGRRGPDHVWHDAFLPAGFTVHAGETVTVTFSNYDSGPHTFTSPSMNVNEVIPAVNYVFDERSQSVVFRTGLGSKLHHLLQASKAAFEIDGTEQHSRTGWSVIIAGITEHVTNPTELHHLESLSLEPWAPGHKGHLVRIRAYSVSGRRIALQSDELPGYRA